MNKGKNGLNGGGREGKWKEMVVTKRFLVTIGVWRPKTFFFLPPSRAFQLPQFPHVSGNRKTFGHHKGMAIESFLVATIA
jgi:hypothetical protein